MAELIGWGPLISISELRDLLESRSVALLDVRWRLGGPPAREAYDKGHLRGAVFVDLETDLAQVPGVHGRHPLPTAEQFTAAMRRSGVSADRPVVSYDSYDSTSAARAWWLLRYFGHTDARVLDGGYAAWLATNGEVTQEATLPEPGDFIGVPGHLPVLDARDSEDLARIGALFDARAPERYSGAAEPVDPVAGHIPGAVSAPTTANVAADGTFLHPAELRERFEKLGAAEGRRVGVYCGSGVTAAHEVLALELAGFRAALYADSWSGWITDASRPVATGDAPG